ncbi:MAG: cytochrome c3 family protein [Woeseiaceae bacterium]|nr:cytochrome c3 family protein [Woeseiaceae bacterium]
MSPTTCAVLPVQAERCWKRLRYPLLIALIAAMPVNADETVADQSPAVPDNIAPPAAPTQPLPFSHATHLQSGLPCQNCHVNSNPGTMMGYPAVATCMMCHNAIATDRPTIKRLQEYWLSEQPIHWLRVYAITPGVTWSHRTHLDAGAQCETCHGDMSQVQAVAETKAIRAMASCISCHKVRGASTACISCHAWPSDQLLGLD